MKKKIIIAISLYILGVGAAFAYTPNPELQMKLEEATQKIELIISPKGETYKANFIGILETYKIKYSNNDRALYILDSLILKLSSNSSLTEKAPVISGEYMGR